MAAAADRSGREAGAVSLVAVTKTVEPVRMLAAIRAGVTDIGENRVQETLVKQPHVNQPVRWHLIGHLQSNKAARAAPAFDTVHSIDGPRPAAALDRHRPPAARPLAVLLEVEMSGIPGRAGVRPEGLPALASAVVAMSRLCLTGLMTIAPPVARAEEARLHFARLRRLRDQLEQDAQIALPDLSMGMSDDFEVAIEEGATIVRVGRAIFGARSPAQALLDADPMEVPEDPRDLRAELDQAHDRWA